MQAELEARQLAAALLASLKKEAAAAERRVREQFEAKLREKQKQLLALQDRLQVRSAPAFLSRMAEVGPTSKIRKERRVCPVRHHTRGLCTQKQPVVQLAISIDFMCVGQAQVLAKCE